MITFEEVKHGYEHNAVRFCNGASLGGFDEIVCCIGHKGWNFGWFYFAGSEAESYRNPSIFLREVGLDNALEWVTNALNDSIRRIDEYEYEFYAAVLKEYRQD